MIRRHGTSAAAVRRFAAAGLAVAGVLLAGGCYPPNMMTLRPALDSLRTVVDTLVVRDSIALALVRETRKEMAEQRDILLSTRAATGSTTKELFEQMERLDTQLSEVLGRFQQVSQRNTPPVTPGGPDPNQLYDQAAQDLTQGRYPLALQGFRDFLARFPTSELADNAQYGIGESFFAQSRFDSAAAEYEKVERSHAQGDKVPAALYKLALSLEKLGDAARAKRTLEDLVQRYPHSGEAQLARERLGQTNRR